MYNTSKLFRYIKVKTWDSLLVFIYYTARPKLLNPISYLRKRYEIRSFQKLKLEQPKLLKIIEEMLKRSKSTGCEYGDYLKIYEYVRNNKPKCILECGSGMSSAVIAFAVQENFQETGVKSEFISMEEDIIYYDNINEIIPSKLKDFVTFVHSESTHSNYGQFFGRHYKNIPQKEYDFVYIDGPSFHTNPGEQARKDSFSLLR